MDLFSSIALFLLSVFVFYYWVFYEYNKKLKKIPSPPKIPILGHVLSFINPENILNYSTRMAKEYGSIIRFQLGPFKQIIVVTELECTKFILSSTKLVTKSLEYKFLARLLGADGLFLSSGIKWRKRRKLLSPTLNYHNLEMIFKGFEKPTKTFLRILKTHTDSTSTEVYNLLNFLTLDIICATAIGVEMNAQNTEASEYVAAIKELERIVVAKIVSPIKMFEFSYRFTKDYQKEKQYIKVVKSYAGLIVQKKTDKLKNNEKTEYQCFLDSILEIKDEDGVYLTDEEIVDEVNTLVVAGHDTTASAISSALYLLANHPNEQAKVVEELRILFGDDKKAPINFSDLNQMRYLDQVIKETLRIYPSASLLARELPDDAKFGDYVFPKGATVLIHLYAIHRNEKYFPDPEKFDPSRFDPENGSKVPFTYIPFSAGPRNCLGLKFVMIEMKYVIAQVLRNFELSPAIPKHELKVKYEATLKSSTGMHINIKERTLSA